MSFRREIMALILISIFTGFLGLGIGSFFESDFFIYGFGIIGLLCPGLYTLEQIRRHLEKK